jgi:hypothetical protein
MPTVKSTLVNAHPIQNGLKQGDAFSPLLSDLLWSMPLGKSKIRPGRIEIGMGHISFWSMLLMIIY